MHPCAWSASPHCQDEFAGRIHVLQWVTALRQHGAERETDAKAPISRRGGIALSWEVKAPCYYCLSEAGQAVARSVEFGRLSHATQPGAIMQGHLDDPSNPFDQRRPDQVEKGRSKSCGIPVPDNNDNRFRVGATRPSAPDPRNLHFAWINQRVDSNQVFSTDASHKFIGANESLLKPAGAFEDFVGALHGCPI